MHLKGAWLQLDYPLAEVDLLWQPNKGNLLLVGNGVHLALLLCHPVIPAGGGGMITVGPGLPSKDIDLGNKKERKKERKKKRKKERKKERQKKTNTQDWI